MEIISSIHRFLGRKKQEIRKASSCWLFSHVCNREENKARLLSIKGKHEGKRCFIVCNGPSLKPADLDVLARCGEVTFASNKIDKLFSKTQWRPTYYAVADEGYQYSLLRSMNAVPSELQFYLTESYLVTSHCKRPSVWLEGKRSYSNTEPMFSYDLEHHVNAFATITYMLIQIAVYMGFKHIYIIGCDNSYAVEQTSDGKIIHRGGTSYFEGMDAKSSKNVGQPWLMNQAYELASQEMQKGKFKIFNATRGGHLEVFPRVDFDTLF